MTRQISCAGVALVAALVSAASLIATPATAQSATHHIERVANQRLAGAAYARLTGLTWDQCVARCLQDQQCQAIEHFRGGGTFVGRNAQCKLLSAPGEARASGTSDIGYKRSNAPQRPPGQVAQERKKDDRDQGAVRRSVEPRRVGEAKPTETARQPVETERAPAPPTAAPPRPTAPPSTGSRPAAPPPVASAPQPPPATAPAPAPSSPPPDRKAAEPKERTRGLVPPAPPPPAGGGGQARTDYDVVPVFYGTDRNRRDIVGKRIAYGADRAGRLELGRALVTVPKLHQVPQVERPWKVTIPYTSIVLYEEKEDPARHFTIQNLAAMSRDEALVLIRERLRASNAYRGQALVLVHGFNNGFDDALYRSAQISYDLNFDGASFLYSWPSGSGLEKYLYDRDSAQQAEPYLTEFLEMVLNETGAEKVNLIAHSMGNQLLLPVLRHLKTRNPALAGKINQIILAAPDVDRDTFTYLAGEIKGVGRGITMYASGNDVALQTARRIAGQKPRAGEVPTDLGPVIVANVDTIDVTSLGTGYLSTNHSSYAEKTALLRDIELVLKTGTRPPERRFPLYQRITTNRGDYWRFPQ
ncbi:MAG: alpha/beta hydrolase [Hyphomicrobiaceae bacterium]